MGITGDYRPNQMFIIPTSLSTNFFALLLEFMNPYHRMSAKELQLTAAFLRKRYELSKVIQDEALRDKILMNNDTKKEIRKECGITIQHFQVMMGNLRKKGVFIGNTIHPKFIPNITDDNYYDLVIRFNLENNNDSSADSEKNI